MIKIFQNVLVLNFSITKTITFIPHRIHCKSNSLRYTAFEGYFATITLSPSTHERASATSHYHSKFTYQIIFFKLFSFLYSFYQQHTKIIFLLTRPSTETKVPLVQCEETCSQPQIIHGRGWEAHCGNLGDTPSSRW